MRADVHVQKGHSELDFDQRVRHDELVVAVKKGRAQRRQVWRRSDVVKDAANDDDKSDHQRSKHFE